jgi:hypothetical protein
MKRFSVALLFVLVAVRAAHSQEANIVVTAADNLGTRFGWLQPER